MPHWLTLDELSCYLKVSRSYLYQQAQNGQIPCSKMGRSWRFDREKIDQWLEKSAVSKVGVEPSAGLAATPPWEDCLEVLLSEIQKEFQTRFASLWIYGSWARGEAKSDSDIDILVVLSSIQDFHQDFQKISHLSYEATFGRGRPFVFSTTLCDQKQFLESFEPIFLNIRREGKKAA